MRGAKVYVYADDTQVRSVFTDEKGRFEVDLDYDAYYRFEFYKRNFVKKKIEIDASQVPVEHQRFGHEWGGWEVELLRKVPGIDTSAYEFPVAKAIYEDYEANFGFDYTYMRSKEEAFKEAEKEQRRMIKEYEKQQKELEAQYASLLAEANKAYDAKEWEKALENYEKIIEIRSDESLARERRDEIKFILNNKEQYNQFVAEAKAKESGGDLDGAIEFWRKAKPLLPELSEAQNEIERITALIAKNKEALAVEARKEEAALMAQAEEKRKAEREALEKKKEEERLKKEAELAAQQKAEEERLRKEKEESERLLAEKRAAEMKEAEEKRLANLGDMESIKERLNQMDKKSDEFVMELAKVYPNGVTEEVEEYKNRTVYKRIVVNNNRGHLYEKVVYNYGGVFYFKDGDSVAQFVWDKETVLD